MRRTLIFVLAAVIVAVAAAAIFLFVTTPRESSGIGLPLSDEHRALLSRVPANAEFFALVPTAAGVESKLRANPITARAIDEWSRDRQLPRPWMLGRADLLVWNSEEGTTFAFNLDPLRALLVRGYATFAGGDVRAEGSTFLIGPAGSGAANKVDEVIARANGLTGDVLVVQRGGGTRFPPLGRPAVSTITVTRRDITIVSRSHRDAAGEITRRPDVSILPRGGILSASFAEPTRVVKALDRLLPGDLAALLSEGGSVVLYDVDTRRLLPRPRGLFIAPDNARTAIAAARLEMVAELVGGVERRDGKIAIAIDRESLPAYATEAFDPMPFPSNLWAMRIDPTRMLPVAERLADHRGLRLAAADIHRSVRNLRDWLRQLSGAGRVEAASVATAGGEELRVVVTAK